MPWTTIREHAVLSLPDLDLVGDIKYDRRQYALKLVDPTTGEEEVLTLSLLASGFVADPGQVFVKDWSEHTGLAAALVAVQICHHIETVNIGPNGVTAYRLQVVDEVTGNDASEATRPRHDTAFDEQVVAAAMRLALVDSSVVGERTDEESVVNEPDPHGNDEDFPDLPPKLGKWTLETCSQCQPVQFCKSELLFNPDVGLNRVYYCLDHGLVSIDKVLD